MMFLTIGDRRLRRVDVRGRAHLRRHFDVDGGHARKRGDDLPRLFAHLILHRTRGRRELDRKGDAASLVDAEVLQNLSATMSRFRSGSRTARSASRTVDSAGAVAISL